VLLLSFVLLMVAALLGMALAELHLKGGLPRWPFGVLHGLVGGAGLGTLLLALRGPPRGEAMGVGAFGRLAAVLLAVALLAGLAVALLRLRHRRVPGVVIGAHAFVAVTGVVVLAAYTLAG
jgi:hypothetical protein